MKTTYIISDNKSVLDWLETQDIENPILTQELDISILTLGDHVIGKLPIHIVSDINEKGAHYGHIITDSKNKPTIKWFTVSPINKPKLGETCRPILESELVTWDTDDENPIPYPIKIEKSGNTSIYVSVGEYDNPMPGLCLNIEIDRGVPTVHIAGDLEADNAMHIHSGDDGIYLAPDIGNFKNAPVNQWSYNQSSSYFVPIERDQDALIGYRKSISEQSKLEETIQSEEADNNLNF